MAVRVGRRVDLRNAVLRLDCGQFRLPLIDLPFEGRVLFPQRRHLLLEGGLALRDDADLVNLVASDISFAPTSFYIFAALYLTSYCVIHLGWIYLAI